MRSGAWDSKRLDLKGKWGFFTRLVQRGLDFCLRVGKEVRGEDTRHTWEREAEAEEETGRGGAAQRGKERT